MNQVVIVHFFGKFCLETDIGYLDEEKIHSKKLITLLAFFLLKTRDVSMDYELPPERKGGVTWSHEKKSKTTETMI